jgi:hypothetical protein
MGGWFLYACVAVWLASAIAWGRAAAAQLRTPLIYSVIWGALAWAVSCGAVLALPNTAFAAVALLGCASVAVLGAKSPGASAWQFVVGALAAVLLLPYVESAVRDRPVDFSGVRWIFVCGLGILSIANYILTRLAFPIILFAVGLVLNVVISDLVTRQDLAVFARFLGVIAVWAAPAVAWYGFCAQVDSISPTTRLWLDFRDRFGAIWALRVMEQFNRSAANAGSSATLTWRGLSGPDASAEYERLTALLKRFGLPRDQKFGPE